VRIRQLTRDPRTDRLQIQTEGNEPLLCPVVEVALDPPPCFIASGDDSCARRDQFGARGRIRDGGRDQLCEARYPSLRTRRQRFVGVCAGD
jgi:hypothetical protein